MRIPARAAGSLVAIAAIAPFGCISPAYAQDATATVIFDGGRIVAIAPAVKRNL